MEVAVKRYSGGKDDTLGLFMIDCSYYCYTIEDEYQNKKVYGETRIPEGKYELALRKVGGFHQRYLKKFGAGWHKGMLWVQDVPGFEYILIHIGNRDDDTAGCILVGNTANNNQIDEGFIGDSTNAYKTIYPIIRDELLTGNKVFIEILTL